MNRWGYAVNAWAPVRREQQERMLKVIAACGFRHIELSCGSGRWQPLGRPEWIARNHGSAAGFSSFLADCGIDGVSSFFFDPGLLTEEEGFIPRSTADPGDRDAIVATAALFTDFLAEVGGSVLVVRPTPSRWQRPLARDGAVEAVARCWEAVGAYARGRCIRVALHVDFLSALRADDSLDRLLDATDPALVGIALDTAELAVAGIDPVTFYRRHRDRVVHVQIKNARQADSRGEYALAHAELNLLRGGGSYGEQRWFHDLGIPGGLVDVARFLAELDAAGYDDWRIVEGDHSPHPAETAMHNTWFLRHVAGVKPS
jgi:inosose dehydratase